MEAFWKWLMRTNARWVFYSALVALLVVIAWWTWKERSPLEPEATIPPSALKDIPPPALGIDAFLASARSKATQGVPTGVFKALEPPPPTPPPTLPTPPTPTSTVKPTPTAPPANPPPTGTTPTIPTPPVQRDIVNLTYRGLFKRTDGRVVALIEDSKSKKADFYSISTNRLFGVGQVESISANQVNLMLLDGSVVPLQIGTNVPFEGGQRVN